MSMFARSIRREFRVATSPKAQPLWFRVLKWVAILIVATRWHDASWFWPSAAACLVSALALHFFYRMKTRAWTRPWGGWRDLDAGRR